MWQWQSLPMLGIQLSVALTSRILRPWPRPQLLLKLLHHLLQVLTGLTFPQQVSSKLLTVSLCMLQLRLQVLNLKGMRMSGQQRLTPGLTTQEPNPGAMSVLLPPEGSQGRAQIPRSGRELNSSENVEPFPLRAHWVGALSRRNCHCLPVS